MLRSSISRKQEALEVTPSAALITSIQDVFTFSPFGLCCQLCNTGAKIQLDERSIQIHLKRHDMDSRVATVRSLFDTFQTQLDSVKALGTIEPYRTDNKTYIVIHVFVVMFFNLGKIVHFDIAKKWGVTLQNCRR